MNTNRQNATPYASASLYVGDLDPEVNEAELYETFNAVGHVNSVRVCRHSATRRSLGYAYVNFHRVDDAERAFETVNFKPIRGRPCRIMWSQRDPSVRKSGVGNIFVKNLASFIDHKTLYDTFSKFGNILSCKVATNPDGKSRGYGFVHYETAEAAAKAIEKADGKEIGDQIVSVLPFLPKQERNGGHSSFTNLYVKHIPESWTEEEFKTRFGKFGTITSFTIKTHGIKTAPVAGEEKKETVQRFGFVNYETTEAAKAAIEGLNGYEEPVAESTDAPAATDAAEGETDAKAEQPKPRKLYVVRALKKSEREAQVRNEQEQRKQERQKKYAGVNLYIKNLVDKITTEELTKHFEPFGDIVNACVMRDANGKSLGFGFVCFTTPESATKAVTEMSGRMLEGKPLYVGLAQRKAERKARFDAYFAGRGKIQPMYPQNMGFTMPPRMMYSPMMPQQWPQAGAMQYNGGRPHHYQLMPVAPGRGQGAGRGRGMGPRRGGGRQRGGGRGGFRNGGQPMPHPMPVQPMVDAHHAHPGMRVPAPHAHVSAQQQPPAQSQPEDEGVSVEELSTTEFIKYVAQEPDEEQRTQLIGERLFPLIEARSEEQAPKITGMLLEMDTGELITLLESESALNEKIDEAMQVLGDEEAEEGQE